MAATQAFRVGKLVIVSSIDTTSWKGERWVLIAPIAPIDIAVETLCFRSVH